MSTRLAIPNESLRLKAPLALGTIVPILGAFYFGSVWLKRKANPKGYPLREDFQPSQLQSLKAFLKTAITGTRYEVSNSRYDYGRIRPRSSGRIDEADNVELP